MLSHKQHNDTYTMFWQVVVVEALSPNEIWVQEYNQDSLSPMSVLSSEIAAKVTLHFNYYSVCI